MSMNISEPALPALGPSLLPLPPPVSSILCPLLVGLGHISPWTSYRYTPFRPTNIVSDRGPQFISQVWKAFYSALGATTSLSSGYHPLSNGQAEWANQELKVALCCVAAQNASDWSTHLVWSGLNMLITHFPLPSQEFLHLRPALGTYHLCFHPRKSMGEFPRPKITFTDAGAPGGRPGTHSSKPRKTTVESLIDTGC